MMIVLVGSIQPGVTRASVLTRLKETHPEHCFDWFQADPQTLRIPKKYLRRLRHLLQSRPNITVFKLFNLHQQDQSILYRHHDSNPVLVPKDIETEDALFDWINEHLFPPWRVTGAGLSLLAILSKLLKNKSWNAGQQGHQWTQESDLLGQSPVRRRKCPESLEFAKEVLDKGESVGLFLSKGGTQGKTPKEWSIATAHLTSVKRSFVIRSPDPISIPQLQQLADYVSNGTADFTVDDGICSKTVQTICKEVR